MGEFVAKAAMRTRAAIAAGESDVASLFVRYFEARFALMSKREDENDVSDSEVPDIACSPVRPPRRH